MMKLNFHKSSGFTLVELLVVVAIIILLSIGAVGGMTYSRQNRSVRNAAEQVKLLFDETRSQALNPTDDLSGVRQFQVRLYPYNSSDNPRADSIEVWKVLSTGNIFYSKYKLPSGIHLIADNATAWGNLTCQPNPCGGNIEYVYFNVIVDPINADPDHENDVGQLDVHPPIGIYVVVEGSNEIYKISMNSQTGSAMLCQADKDNNYNCI